MILHQGVIPSTQWTRAPGCEHDWDDAQLAWRPRLDAHGATTRPGVWVAGDGGGIIGGPAAVHDGARVADAIATELADHSAAPAMSAAQDRASHASLAAHLAPRPFLDRLYRPADALRLPRGNTIVCRCEDVSAASGAAILAEGCPGPNQLKFFSRCGMGPCQGRMCGTTISEMVAAARGIPVQHAGHYRIRQPIKPLPLGVLATAAAPVEKSKAYMV